MRAASSAAGLVGLGRARGASQTARNEKDAQHDEEEELQRAEARVRKITSGRLLKHKSPHYQAIGDASDFFIKLTLSDCEQAAADYLRHFRSRGFDVKLPDRRLTVVVFRDVRPFLRFAEIPQPGLVGFYSKAFNWLALFDFRNVPTNLYGSGQSNMETVTHEATHQLTYNTGLLWRKADIPRSVVEGLAMYCEQRQLFGRNEPGQANLRRLQELAQVWRREPWISAAELLSDDRACFGRTADRQTLSYCESWLLVYHLMNDPDRLPQFRAYLDAIRGRTDATQRLKDAGAHFGDLARLDRELRQEVARLQRAL
jgi:hypothetical protein